MQNYSLITSASPSGPRVGLVTQGQVVDLAPALPDRAARSVADVLQIWDEALPLLDALAANPDASRVPLEGLTLLAPVPAPLAVYCIGANYQQHLDNMMRAQGRPPQPNSRDRGMPPFFFLKSGHCIVPTETDVPQSGEKLDWEAELVAVVGCTVRDVSVKNALDCIAGYTLANDLSARDRAVRKNGDPASPFFFDFVAQKSFDASCPLGPALIPGKFVADPQALPIKLWVNDRLRIDSSTSEMIYTIAEQIAHLSTFATLHPGDLILTGTPAGVGAETDEHLHRGDVVRVQIDGIGTLRNTIV